MGDGDYRTPQRGVRLDSRNNSSCIRRNLDHVACLQVKINQFLWIEISVIERHPLPDGGHVSMAAILNIPDSSRGHAVAENLAIAFIGAGCRTLSPHLAQFADDVLRRYRKAIRSEEHTSELQSLMRISYAVFCLKQKNQTY